MEDNIKLNTHKKMIQFKTAETTTTKKMIEMKNNKYVVCSIGVSEE